MNIKLTKHYKEPKSKYTVLSSTIFRVKDNYKPFNLYYEGLKDLIDKFRSAIPKSYLRIYYDDSIITPKHNNKEIDNDIINNWIPLFEEMKKNKYIQLVHFEIVEYKNGIYHDGLLGTVIRLLPLFNVDIDNANVVIVTDIDAPDSTPYIINNIPEILTYMKVNKTKFHFKTYSCSLLNRRFNILSDDDLIRYEESILAGTIVSKVKFDINYLDEFLNCINDNKFKTKLIKCDFVNEFIKLQNNLVKSKFTINKHSKFVYGIDEIFLVKYIKEIILIEKIPYSYSLMHVLDENIRFVLFTWNIRTDYFNNNNKYLPLWKKIMGKHFIEHSSKKNYFKLLELINKNVNLPSSNVSANSNANSNANANSNVNANANSNVTYINTNITNAFEELLKTNTYINYDLRLRDINCIVLNKDVKDFYSLHKWNE
jgi:hypothetical protein